MEQKDLIKWALIAAGAYLVYKWLADSGMFGGLLAQPQTGAGATTGVTTGTTATQTQAQTQTQPVAQIVAAEPSDDLRMQAASDASKAGLTGSFRLNSHEWNWYRAAYFTTVLGQPFDQNTMSPVNLPDPDAKITASEYWAKLRSAGLSGMGWGSGSAYGTYPAPGRRWTGLVQ